YRLGGLTRRAARRPRAGHSARAGAPSPRRQLSGLWPILCPRAVARLSRPYARRWGLEASTPRAVALAAGLQPHYKRPPRNPYRFHDGLHRTAGGDGSRAAGGRVVGHSPRLSQTSAPAAAAGRPALWCAIRTLPAPT